MIWAYSGPQDCDLEGGGNALENRPGLAGTRRAFPPGQSEFMKGVENHVSSFFDGISFGYRSWHLDDVGRVAAFFGRLEHNREFAVHVTLLYGGDLLPLHWISPKARARSSRTRGG